MLQDKLSEATLRSLYVDEQKTCREIGDMFGVSHQTVLDLMGKYGIPRRFRQLDAQHVQSLMTEGFTAAIIGHKLGFATRTVRAFISRHNLQWPPKQRPHRVTPKTKRRSALTQDQHGLCWQLFCQGDSYQQIATKLDVTPASVGAYIRTQESYKEISEQNRLGNQEAWRVLSSPTELTQLLSSTTIKDACKALGVCDTTIKKYASMYGIQWNRLLMDSIPELQDEALLRGMYETMSIASIADHLGVSHPVVRSSFEQLGIETNASVGTSKLEKQITAFIRDDLGIENVISNDRSVLHPQELDIWLPDKRVAIEVAGCYWHSDKFKPRWYHRDKLDAATSRNVRLITLFESDWVHRRQIVESKLRSILGSNTRGVFARKCSVSEIPSRDARTFMENNHIQGSANCSIVYVLKLNDSIVALIGLRNMGNGVYDLVRYCSSERVVGGFTKLLAHFVKEHRPKEVYTFADLRWSSPISNMYTTAGFRQEHITKPAYYWYDRSTKDCYHRMGFQRKFLPRVLGHKFNPDHSEVQNMKNAGWLRIYDCGHIKYRLMCC